MDELAFYQNHIEQIALIKEWEDKELIEHIKSHFEENKELVMKLIALRKEVLTEAEQAERPMQFYKDCFTFIGEEDRLALTAMFIEIFEFSGKHFHELSFEPYNMAQPLFQRHPEILQAVRQRPGGAIDPELVKLSVIGFNPIPNMPYHRTCKYNQSFLLTSRYLDGRIPEYLINKYGRDNIYIRIEPYEVHSTPPKLRFLEEFMHLPNPEWIRNLKMHINQKEGCQLFIPAYTIDQVGKDPKRNEQYKEYHIKKIRRFETIATMKNENGHKHFSMSLEELSEEKDGMLIGRMIHLDSLNSYDTPFDKIWLKHLDLAINVYTGEAKDERLRSNLSSGGVIPDASYRTHLIRVDGILFSDLVHLARLFFKSKIMIEEWIEKQFERVVL
ncbi:hypothetical protein C3496_10465 [Bacillus anthracis]|uniref:hypothetical protein n=1 Tax=Bacillus TaxID=1386 RepID=UPI0010A68493|nr:MULTISPECIES: hypothetical protein [Bacillus]QBJ66774.1 hypothetical protein C3496_10465 [Bacillus anthracis]THG62948.1 hypothetical protein E7Y01_04160 [Bacillus sp. HUB-I-004]